MQLFDAVDYKIKKKDIFKNQICGLKGISSFCCIVKIQ